MSVEAKLEDLEGEERVQVLSGEPVVLRLVVEGQVDVPPPRVSVELRDRAGALLGGAAVETAELGWSDEPGRRTLRFELDRLPLADGRFWLGVSLADGEGSRLYHRIDRAAEFLVYPDEEIHGAVRLDGRWSLAETRTELEPR